MNFINLYIKGYGLEYIASKNQCNVSEVQEALLLACGFNNRTKTLNKTGERIISQRAKHRSLSQISKELRINLLKLSCAIIEDLRAEELKTLKYIVFPIENSEECPCCKTKNCVKRVVLPESNDVTGTGKTRGMYCSNCGSEYVLRGNTANVLNWDYIKKLYT